METIGKSNCHISPDMVEELAQKQNPHESHPQFLKVFSSESNLEDLHDRTSHRVLHQSERISPELLEHVRYSVVLP